ncbi:MAG: hypothetical protein WC469_01655 [Candidatus Omnitrophota bacterium]
MKPGFPPKTKSREIKLIAVAVLYVTAYLAQRSSAEAAFCKSGKQVRTDVVEKTGEHIGIDYRGTPNFYEMKCISDIKDTDSSSGNHSGKSSFSIIEENRRLKKELGYLEGLVRKTRAEYSAKLGDAYLQGNFFEEAIRGYQDALEFGSEDPGVEYNLAVLLESYKNDVAGAIRHYRNYLRLKPDTADKKEIEGVIALLQGKLSSLPLGGSFMAIEKRH